MAGTVVFRQDDIGSRVDGPDLVAVGLDVTGLMSMLWTVASGRRAVGLGAGYPAPAGACWNLTADIYHQLALLDELMYERYGEHGVPRRADGQLIRLAVCFYRPDAAAAPAPADQGAVGAGQHVAGPVGYTESTDDRWRAGVPQRERRVMPIELPDKADSQHLRAGVAEVLAAARPFRVLATDLAALLRRYLQAIEQLDRQRAAPPRVRLLDRHRVAAGPPGFAAAADGRLRIRAEAAAGAGPADGAVAGGVAAGGVAGGVAAGEAGGVAGGVPAGGTAAGGVAGGGGVAGAAGAGEAAGGAGTELVDLGVPELFLVSQGVRSPDAERLGFTRTPVLVDRGDGQGPVAARSDLVVGLLGAAMPVPVRRRIATEPDEDRDEYWVRQYAVAHPHRPEATWLAVEVPDFLTFDPVELDRLPAGTDRHSAEFAAAYRELLSEFFHDQAAQLLGVPAAALRQRDVHYGPTLHCRAPSVGDDPRVAPNGLVAGETYGTGQALNAEDCLVGIVGHSARLLDYWRHRDAGATTADALDRLAAGIRADTADWLAASAADLTEADHTHFLPGCYEEIDAARCQRQLLSTLPPAHGG
jgi:hypothetical protein